MSRACTSSLHFLMGALRPPFEEYASDNNLSLAGLFWNWTSASVAIFPQMGEIKVDEAEEKYHNLKDENSLLQYAMCESIFVYQVEGNTNQPLNRIMLLLVSMVLLDNNAPVSTVVPKRLARGPRTYFSRLF